MAGAHGVGRPRGPRRWRSPPLVERTPWAQRVRASAHTSSRTPGHLQPACHAAPPLAQIGCQNRYRCEMSPRREMDDKLGEGGPSSLVNLPNSYLGSPGGWAPSRRAARKKRRRLGWRGALAGGGAAAGAVDWVPVRSSCNASTKRLVGVLAQSRPLAYQARRATPSQIRMGFECMGGRHLNRSKTRPCPPCRPPRPCSPAL
jgi:hypothetical protein